MLLSLILTLVIPLLVSDAKLWPNTQAQLMSGHQSFQESSLARRGLLESLNRGEATFYDVGLGACEAVNSNSEFVGALNHIDFGPVVPPRSSPACSSCVLVWAPAVPQTPPVRVKIVDKCPGCQIGDIDLSPAVFNHFFEPGKGRFDIVWTKVSCSGGSIATLSDLPAGLAEFASSPISIPAQQSPPPPPPPPPPALSPPLSPPLSSSVTSTTVTSETPTTAPEISVDVVKSIIPPPPPTSTSVANTFVASQTPTTTPSALTDVNTAAETETVNVSAEAPKNSVPTHPSVVRERVATQANKASSSKPKSCAWAGSSTESTGVDGGKRK